MEEEKENRKIPNTAFCVLLFLFFYMLIRMFFRDVPLLLATWRDSAIAEDEPLLYVLVPSILYIVWIIVSLWSVIRVLKVKPDSVPVIRWALVIGLLVALSRIWRSLGKVLTIHWMFALPSVLLFLFIVIFLVYLQKSGSVKDLFPPSERRFASGGWIWVLYLAVWVVMLSVAIVQTTEKSRKTRDVPVEKLTLPQNSHCDGKILFESPIEWEMSDDEFVDFDGEPYKVSVYRYESDSIILNVWCGMSEKTRHSDYMAVLLQAIPFDISLTVSEEAICDTIIGEDQCYIEQYNCETDSFSFDWTFSVRFDSQSNKYCAYSLLKKHSSPEAEYVNSIRFLESVVFDLTPYKKER